MPESPAPATAAPERPGTSGALDALTGATGSTVLRMRDADVGSSREDQRRRRFVKLSVLVWVLVGLLWARAFTMGGGDFFPIPTIDPFLLVIVIFFGLLIALVAGQQLMASRSPHMVFRPEQIDTCLDDVVGIDGVKDDVVRSLNLFLAHKTFRDEMGGSPRRGLLFEGAPGTGKTHLAKAMAREAGVPFLFVSATSFQSMWYGATAKKIRSYFKALRKAARKEGGAIGFIEEIDAIAMTRGGMNGMTPIAGTPFSVVHGCSGTSCLPTSYAQLPAPSLQVDGAGTGIVKNGLMSEGTGGVVNEMLVQMQSFDDPTGGARLKGWFVDRINLLLPPHRQLKRPANVPTNILLIAATNRADGLDPALLRPGRFDRRLTFELPSKPGRRALIDHFLSRKTHDAELDDDSKREALAGILQGYTPVMIEHLLDEALVSAVRRGDSAMCWKDVEQARLVEEVGTGQPVGYTAHEKRLIATHEAGHATIAWLTAPERRLEVLTIIKRRSALGLLAHGDREEVYTRSRKELTALVQIAMGGQCAEEVFFGDVSTGPGGDLLYATNTAAEMIGAHGMEESLVSYLAVQNSGFSDTNIVGRVLADDRGRDAVEALLQRNKAAAKALMLDNKHLVEALRDALLKHEELVGDEITDVLEAAAAEHGVVRPRQVVDLTLAEDAAAAAQAAPVWTRPLR